MLIQLAKKSLLIVCALVALVVVNGCDKTSGIQDRHTEIWELTKQLTEATPHTVASVEKVTGIELREGSDPTRYTFEGDAKSPQGARISATTVAMGESGAWAFTTVDFAPKGCIGPDEAKLHYPNISRDSQVADTSAQPTYAMMQNLGDDTEISIWFSENGNCLVGISIEDRK